MIQTKNCYYLFLRKFLKIDLSTWISDEISKSDRPELSTAKIIVSGGRAMKSAENFVFSW